MQVYGVHEVTTYLRELFETDPHLSDIWVAGEVSNVNRPASGHVYFTLKDDGAAVRSVFFARRGQPSSHSARLIESGHAVVAHGRISLYEQRGDLQFYVDFVQPEGVGALQMEYERLKARLAEEGLFDDTRKRPLPRFPGRIGVVTSPSGAVFQDICHVLERRWPLAEIVLAPARVQGPESAASIVGALDTLNRRGDLDVIICARGGGSIEELWAFNEEPVARAVFASATPVVSAVGHETDFTIADFVADLRAPTPSAAAQLVAPDRLDVSVRLSVAAGAMTSVVAQLLSRGRERVRHELHSIDRSAPRLDRERIRIDDAARALQTTIDRGHRDAVSGVGGCVWRLRSLDPLATLGRGFAVVQNRARVVSSVRDVSAGDRVDVVVKDGRFAASVGDALARQRRRIRRQPEAQAPLFTMPEERA